MNEIARYFDSRADDWEKTFNRPSAVQGAVAAIAGIGPGSRVLDLGCGTGIMADVYLTLGVSQVVALDIAPRMIEIAQKKYENEPRIDFRCRDAVEFEDEEGFDAVVIYNAYPHFLDKDARETRRQPGKTRGALHGGAQHGTRADERPPSQCARVRHIRASSRSRGGRSVEGLVQNRLHRGFAVFLLLCRTAEVRKLHEFSQSRCPTRTSRKARA